MPLQAIKTVTVWLATATEGIAGIVIAIAVIEAALRTGMLVVRRNNARGADPSHEARSR